MAKEQGETRILFLTDIHAPYHDQRALDIAIDFGLQKDIDEVIISELPDFYKVGHWMKDPNRMPFYKELDAVKEMVVELNMTFRNKIITYLVGNHEERIVNYMRTKCPEMCDVLGTDIATLMGVRSVGWEFVDNRQLMMSGARPLQRGKLTILHGHEVKMGWGAVNLAKIMYERSRCNVIAGHHHRCQEWIVRVIDGKHEGCWMVGCLGDLHPEYMPHNDWIHGFAIIHMYEDGNFSIENRKIIGGKVL